MITPELPAELDARLRSELNADEVLIWAGQPLPHHFRKKGYIGFFLGIVWTAFHLVWLSAVIWGVMHSKADSIFLLFIGGLFVLLGVLMLAEPSRQARIGRKTVYALTDKRGIILAPNQQGQMTVSSIPADLLSPRTRTQNGDGSGSLFFTHCTVTQRGNNFHGGNVEVPLSFEHLGDFREVENLIEQAYRASV